MQMQVGRITELGGGKRTIETADDQMTAPFVVAELRDVLEKIEVLCIEGSRDNDWEMWLTIQRIRDLAAKTAAKVSKQ